VATAGCNGGKIEEPQNASDVCIITRKKQLYETEKNKKLTSDLL
jgi:hypothetical protein